MRITLAKLYSRTREDGAVVLAGRIGWSGGGMLRVLPADDYDPNDPKSAPFILTLEEAPVKAPQPYNGPQINAPQVRPSQRQSPALPDYCEGEIVER